MDQKAPNPLAKHFRQPAIYMSLPSGGKYWPEGTLDMPETGELPVFPMTTRDEVTIRTPDALINGTGVVDVIKSCIPAMVDPWKMPSIDVDATLISMRIASYGHSMDFETKCPHCAAENTYGLDLRSMLATIKCPDFDQMLDLDDVLIKFQPQTYFDSNKVSQMSFELTRLEMAAQDLEVSDEKTALKVQQMNRLVDLNLDVVTAATEYILDKESQTKVTDRTFVREYYSNIDTNVMNKVSVYLGELVKDANIKPQNVDCHECGGKINLEILFDYANFFVVGF